MSVGSVQPHEYDPEWVAMSRQTIHSMTTSFSKSQKFEKTANPSALPTDFLELRRVFSHIQSAMRPLLPPTAEGITTRASELPVVLCPNLHC